MRFHAYYNRKEKIFKHYKHNNTTDMRTKSISITVFLFSALVSFMTCGNNNNKATTSSNDAQTEAVGEQKEVFSDFTMPNLDRNDVSTTSIISKNDITIIDFWASWCGPCRSEMPSLVALYNKYRNDGLGILGISLDKDYDAWKQAIDNDKMAWEHLSELRGWDNTAVKALRITSIPHTIVVDRQAKVLSRGLRGKQLADFIDNLMKDKKAK